MAEKSLDWIVSRDEEMRDSTGLEWTAAALFKKWDDHLYWNCVDQKRPFVYAEISRTWYVWVGKSLWDEDSLDWCCYTGGPTPDEFFLQEKVMQLVNSSTNKRVEVYFVKGMGEIVLYWSSKEY